MIPEFGTFRISTATVPAADRVAVWREDVGPLVRMDIEPQPALPFHADIAMRILPGLGVMAGRTTLRRAGRSRSLLADGNDDLMLQFRTVGGVARQLNREVPVAAGAAILVSNADEGSFTYDTPGDFFALRLPRAALGGAVRDLDASLLRAVPADNQALRLLGTYVRALPDDDALADPDLCRVTVAHVHDLVALVLGANRDAAEVAGHRGLPAARLRAIKADVVRSLEREADVSVGSIARRHQVTTRYVQRLFEREGTTFTRYVLGKRLDRGRRMLVDPRLAARGITEVAFDAGFGDLSYFNRCFRRAYGVTPSQMREQAERGGGRAAAPTVTS